MYQDLWPYIAPFRYLLIGTVNARCATKINLSHSTFNCQTVMVDSLNVYTIHLSMGLGYMFTLCQTSISRNLNSKLQQVLTPNTGPTVENTYYPQHNIHSKINSVHKYLTKQHKHKQWP